MQAIKGNFYWLVLVKYSLNFTRAENENQYLTKV